MLPTVALPVWMPMRIPSGASPSSRRRAFSARIPSAIASAARQARSAASAWASGAPQKAITESPMNLSTVPSSISMQPATISKWRLTSAATSGADRCSATDENPAISVNMTVILRAEEIVSSMSPRLTRRPTIFLGT